MEERKKEKKKVKKTTSMNKGIWRKLKSVGRILKSPQVVAAFIAALLSLVISGFILPYVSETFSQEPKIRGIIDNEANLILARETNQVVSLFADDAYIKDAAGGNSSSEVIWVGHNAIERRYGELPQFISLKHDAIDVTFSTDKKYARATADTIESFIVNGEVINKTSNQGEKWTFQKTGDTWKITGFIYNLP